jgi:hypothetical protein
MPVRETETVGIVPRNCVTPHAQGTNWIGRGVAGAVQRENSSTFCKGSNSAHQIGRHPQKITKRKIVTR